MNDLKEAALTGECSISKLAARSDAIAFFCAVDDNEMLKIAQDGFYVRGVKLPQDDNEARAVYEAFMAWLRATGSMK